MENENTKNTPVPASSNPNKRISDINFSEQEILSSYEDLIEVLEIMKKTTRLKLGDLSLEGVMKEGNMIKKNNEKAGLKLRQAYDKIKRTQKDISEIINGLPATASKLKSCDFVEKSVKDSLKADINSTISQLNTMST